MQYFKNVDLAKLYSVSEGTVRRWINAARDGKLDLQLFEDNDKYHVANTAKNQLLIKELVAKGKKHSNSRWHRMVTPTEDFYQLYSKRQIVDIITNIDIHREIPMQYGYFGDGAKWWNGYSHRLWKEGESNTIKATVELLQSNSDNIDRLTEGYERVNIIDIGAGNALPVKELLTHLLYDESILARYIALDISPQMLELAKQNIDTWFEGRVNFEGHIRDITYERFDDLLIEEDPDKAINIVLLFGGTINNFRSPDEVLKVIYHSMSRNCLLIVEKKLDSEETRRYFDFNTEPEVPSLPLIHQFLLDTLSLDNSLYDVEQGYDKEKRVRFIGIRPKLDLTIKFDIDGKERFVNINKGELLLLWRAWHQNAMEAINQLDHNNFNLIEASTTDDEQYLLTISKIRSNPRPIGS